MEKSMLYVAIDVDDLAFHGAGYDEKKDKFYEFKCKPTVEGLLKRIEILCNKGFEVQVCYEATYIGYGSYRDLKTNGINCDIIARTSVKKSEDRPIRQPEISCALCERDADSYKYTGQNR